MTNNYTHLLHDVIEALEFSRGYMDRVRVADDKLEKVNQTLTRLRAFVDEVPEGLDKAVSLVDGVAEKDRKGEFWDTVKAASLLSMAVKDRT
jgi:hypothetical protein